MLFSRIQYEDLIDQFVEKYNNECQTDWSKRALILETVKKFADLRYKAFVRVFVIIFARLYNNNLVDLGRDMAKISLLGGKQTENRREDLKVIWWVLGDYLDHDASIIFNAIEERLNIEP